MAQIDASLTTGLPGFDRIIKGLIPGDNLVWRVDSHRDYQPFVLPFCKAAQRIGQPLIYFRFAREDPPLVPAGLPAEVHELDPRAGFEVFVTRIHEVIEATGRGGYYVFDCLSELAEAW